MTGPPGDMTKTPYRPMAAVEREARRNERRREQLGRSKTTQSGFSGNVFQNYRCFGDAQSCTAAAGPIAPFVTSPMIFLIV
jgi:hypothetical protein